MTVMAAHQPTKALASFAADLDPAALPPEVRQKLGWLLLDYLRVCSIGARLPWSDWARKYIPKRGSADPSTSSKGAEALPAPMPMHGILRSFKAGSASASISWMCW